MWVIEMTSDVYGSETFEYNTKKEATMGMGRLIDDTIKQSAIDDIERHVTFLGEMKVEGEL